MSDVLYFIDPTNNDSLQKVIDDFPPDDQDEFDYDQYGKVHLCFCNSSSQS
jgi:hypothetical protein